MRKVPFKVLSEMAQHLSRAKRRFFVRYGILGEKLTDLKRDFIANEGLTARQLNSIVYDVKGLLAAQKEIKKTQKKINKTKERIKSSKSDFKTHQFKRQLHQTEKKLQTFQKHLVKPSVCFGEKGLFQKQFRLKENGFTSHEAWKKEWKQTRDSGFFLIGSKDETFGNQSCQLFPGRIHLRLTHTLAKKFGRERIEIPIEFSYQKERLQAALAAKQALHFRFLRKASR